MRIRCLILVIIGLTPFLVSGQTYYEDGMQFRTRISSTSFPESLTWIKIYTLEKTYDENCFRVYSYYEDNSDAQTFEGLIKTEESKVYFSPEESETSDWYLIYDFSLQPGEGCYVYSPYSLSGNYTPYKTYVKCVGIEEGYYDGKWSRMQMQEYYDEEDTTGFYQNGYWVKGLSSIDGLLSNNRFEQDGGGSTLLEVYDNDKIVFFNPQGVISNEKLTFYAEGMKFSTYISSTTDPYPHIRLKETIIEKGPEYNSYRVYSTYEENLNKWQYEGVIKAEESKVYFSPEESETSDWYLIYDFSLQPGEGCYVYSPYSLSGNYTPYKTYVKCVGIEEGYYNGELSLMHMEEYADENDTSMFLGAGSWIKGLTSLTGLLDNNRFEVDGGGSRLAEISDKGEILYSNPNAGIVKTSVSGGLDINVSGLDIYITADEDVAGSLYYQDGILVGSYSFNSVPKQIKVPGQGVYILKIGTVTKKILVP